MSDNKEQGKIYRRDTLLKNTKPKKKGAKNRKKSVCVNFRVTPEEKKIIFNRIRLSGLKIQDYVAQSCMYNQISVVWNIKTFDAIRNEMKTIDEHLMSLKSVDEHELDKLESLRIILEILDGFYKNSDSLKNLFKGDLGKSPQRVKLYKSTLLANLEKVVKVVLASGILVMLETAIFICII